MKSITRRRLLKTSALAGAGALLTWPSARVLGANDAINLAVIGLGSRGGGHCGWFGRIPGVRIAGLCDPDKDRLARQQQRFPQAQACTDVRKLLENKNIDAVAIATCNHWHALAGIWAAQAGKHVYVEKPISHNNFEGRKLVEASRKYNVICQGGTQQRSDPVQQEIKQFLAEGHLGKILYVRANRYGGRGPIGKRSEPMPWPQNVVKDLWLGPAQDKPIFRNKLQYDWHWDWNTGNGEMGNWGVHILDDVRWVALDDKCGHPLRICAGGGRLVWDDAGETPNRHFVFYDTGIVPVVFDLSNLPISKQDKRSPAYMGTRSGYTIHCEGGRYSGGRGGGRAYDNQGKTIKTFSGDAGGKHAANFIEAVRKHDRSIQNAEILQTYYSTSWCNLANVAYRVGKHHYSPQAAKDMVKGYKPWAEVVDMFHDNLEKLGADPAKVVLGPMLEIDPDKETFVGPTATAQAKALWSRTFRKGYEVPEKV